MAGGILDERWHASGLKTPNDLRPQRLSIPLTTVVVGLLGGSLELAVFLLKCRYFDPRNLNVSRQYPWMFLASSLLIVSTCALLLALFDRVRPGKIGSRAIVFWLSGPAVLGVLFRLPISTAASVLLAVGLSVRLADFLADRQKGFERWGKRWLIGCGALAIGMGLSVTWAEVGDRSSRRSKMVSRFTPLKNVLLVVLDTVRADQLILDDPLNSQTPNLARFAKRGVRFEQAYSTAPWTAPSHASLFTGRWPHELAIDWDRPLEDGPETLAEFLGERGLETGGFVANTTYCSYETGLDRGFKHYEDYDVNIGQVLLCSSITQRFLNAIHHHPKLLNYLPSIDFAKSTRKDASRIRADFLNWLSRQDERPFFAFLNVYDAHHPYLTPEGETPRRSLEDQRLLKTWWDVDKRTLSKDDLVMARSAYQGCIRYLDQEIGKLLDELDRRKRLDDTLVVITADHGEQLGERDLYGHGCSLYRSELHVPLIVIGGNDMRISPGRSVREPVSLRDVPATVADLLGFGDGERFPGRTLVPSWTESGARPERLLLSEIEAPPEVDPNGGRSPVQRGKMRSLIAGGLHYIKNGDGFEELYAIESDPLETRNLAEDPAFRSRLEAFQGDLPASKGSEPSGTRDSFRLAKRVINDRRADGLSASGRTASPPP